MDRSYKTGARFARRIFSIFLPLTIALILHGCGPRTGIEIKGSDTMVNLTQTWVEAFLAEHPEANLVVTGGGSGVGIAALINKDVDIALSSRDMSDQELEWALERGLDPQEFDVALDGIVVIVNPENPVFELTIAQLSDIFTGRITNWAQLGGPNQRIIVLSRDRSSGTHPFFLDEVVRRGVRRGPEEFAPGVLMLPSSHLIADEIAQNANAIGYIGIGYVEENVHQTIWVAREENTPYVRPTIENILDGSYPIARPMHFYTPGLPEGLVQDFIDFVLSDEGQRIVIREHFVPVREVEP